MPAIDQQKSPFSVHPEDVLDGSFGVDGTGFVDDPLKHVSLMKDTYPSKEGAINVSVSSPLGDKLLFDCALGEDALSELFEYHVRLYSEKEDLDVSALLGKNMTLSLVSLDGKKTRYISGIVTHARSLPAFLMDASKKIYRAYYSVIIRPKLWLSTLTKNFRVFMKKKPKEIIETILGEDGVSFTNKASSAGNTVREYCLQYNETNFEFVSRLMEEEGIFYFFEYGAAGETMILADANKAANDIGEVSMKVPSSEYINRIFFLNSQAKMVTKKYSSVDVDYMKPDTTLKASGSGSQKKGEWYEYPGLFLNSGLASKAGERHIKAISWPEKLVFGRGSVLNFSSGSIVKVSDHLRKDLNQKYLLYSVRTFIQQRPDPDSPTRRTKLSLTNAFTALPNDTPFVPRRKTPKPHIDSVQTALVVGPSGKEIYSDEEGRVFVQFLWDREGAKDGKNSCPVRCMQGWAGPGFGLAFVPRIGMVVVVSFENGDPDRPLIVGCIYNGKNPMPAAVTKEPRICMLKTKTSEKDGDKANIMSFDDTKDAEKITFNATKDFELSSKADDNLSLYKQAGKNTVTRGYIEEGLLEGTIKKGDRKFTIEEGNDTLTLKKGNLTITLNDGNEVVTLDKGDYTIKISKGKLTITAKDNISISTDAKMTISSKGDMTFDSKGKILVKAAQDVTIQAGMNLNLKSGMNTAIKASMNLSAEASLAFSAKGLSLSTEGTLSWMGKGLSATLQGTVSATVQGSVTAQLTGLTAKVTGSALASLGGGAVSLGI